MSLQKFELTYSQEQVNLIKSQIAKDATDNELKLFLYQCQRTGLDPLTRQIYYVKRSGRMTIQTSIDGFRVIAERSGMYAGQDAPIWTYDDKGNILNCSVTVYKFGNGVRYPAATGVAFYKEYYPNPMNLQKSLAHTMIAKVAEALALRKAFPQDLSGLYTADEMNQADLTPLKEELIASLIDLDMDEEKKKVAYDSISNAADLNTLNRIKVRLTQFDKTNIDKAIKEQDELIELKDKSLANFKKPDPEVTKALNSLTDKLKANV